MRLQVATSFARNSIENPRSAVLITTHHLRPYQLTWYSNFEDLNQGLPTPSQRSHPHSLLPMRGRGQIGVLGLPQQAHARSLIGPVMVAPQWLHSKLARLLTVSPPKARELL